MRIAEVRVAEVIFRSKDVLSVRLAADGDMAYEPGQFLGVTLSGNGAELSRYLSFSSSPTETGYIEFTKRLTGSDFSTAMAGLRPGDAVKIKYPMGKFVLDETRPKHAFLAGGIGITPMRSMWKYAFDKKLPLDMVLLYGCRSVADLIFKTDFEDIAARDKRYKAVFSLDSADQAPAGWQGCCGYIDAAMIRREIPDHAERVFYLCGPTVMVKKMADILKGELAIPEANIRRESISGYEGA